MYFPGFGEMGFGETGFGETGFGESGFSESGRHHWDCHKMCEVLHVWSV